MGKRDKTLKSNHSLVPINPPIVHVIISDDDDEVANEDLSSKIVEKSLLLACNASLPDASVEESLPAPEDDGGVVVKSRRKVKKMKKKIKKKPEETDEVVGAKDEEKADISKVIECAEKEPVEKSDSLVLRKLLRGPRYFDPPDSGSGLGECYNCGQEGHVSANCTSAKRRKPCFICGSLEHQAKQCTKGQDCYICKKGGHRAKDCPENDRGASKIWKICLKCGDYGHHDMFSCNNDYSPEDLKGIQCYICNSFSHLCCSDFNDTGPVELSCYRCGQLGHGGMDCGKSWSQKTNMGSAGKCYKCQEVGHIAKNCPSSTKDGSHPHFEKANVRSPGKCHGCGEEGHIARDCPSSIKVARMKSELSTPTQKFPKERRFKKSSSVTSEAFKTQKRKKAEFEENRTPTSYSLKKRGGWITEDPIDSSGMEGRVRRWGSPVTPTYDKSMVYSSGVNGHDFRFDDIQHGSMVSYRHDPFDQPRDRYRPGASNQPYREYRHDPSDESYHRYRHALSNGPHHRYEDVPSNRPHHQYVVSPSNSPYLSYADAPSNGPSSIRAAYPHHAYEPSPSHHQPYPSSGSPNFFQPRFHNSNSDGMRRTRHRHHQDR